MRDLIEEQFEKLDAVAKEEHMGLGLYLAKKILEMHGLKLRVENTKTGVKVIIAK